MASLPDTFDELVTTTLRNRRGKIVSNVENGNVLLAWLKRNGNVDPATGGRELVEEIAHAENQTFKWYEGYEVLDITPQSVLGFARYPWKQGALSISASGGELAINSGKEALIRLAKERTTNGEESMMNNLGIGVYSNGSANGGKQMGGLQLLVADAPTSGVVGGIDRAEQAFWQNQFKDAATVFSSLTSASVLALMQEVFLEIVAAPGPQGGGAAPNLIVAGVNAFTTYWNALVPNQRFTDPNTAISGFRSLEFAGPQGVAPVFFDPQCNTNRMYMLSTKYLKYRPHNQRNVSWSNARQSQNQDSSVTLLFWMGNLTASNMGRHGVIFD
ncbi:MAG TPA: phage major capsid protein [Methyloceanibacter sp.]|nr:phage major capsid protein [Methyloceanibacter sp.]